MIKYSLKCKDCSSQFESWFASSEEFDRLKKLKLLNCQDCDSLKVDKSLMSPNLVNTKKMISKIMKNIKKLKRSFKITKNLLRKTLIMLEIIFRMRQDLYITIKRKQKKVFMVRLL